MNSRFSFGLIACMSVLAASGLRAQNEISRPDDHAPIGVMGDHYHEAGEFMFSYRYMSMNMQGNRIGSSAISRETIATTVPNRFFGLPMQPPTLRVVPTEMTMDMHMLGLMYAPSDGITLMGMTSYVTKEMDHVTYMGPGGTSVLGGFRTKTSGVGDTSLSALIRLHETERHRLHVTAGLSVPTGSVDETGTVLAPNGAMPTLRLPYPMLLGSGSYDLLHGLTWTSFLSDLSSVGIQWRGTLRTSDNDEDYRLGDEYRLTAWYGRRFRPQLSWSARIEWFDRGNIDGIDSAIVAPVQTADPARQAATRTDFALGLNFVASGGHRLSVEWLTPLAQDLDGPQLEVDDQLILGYQLSF